MDAIENVEGEFGALFDALGQQDVSFDGIYANKAWDSSKSSQDISAQLGFIDWNMTAYARAETLPEQSLAEANSAEINNAFLPAGVDAPLLEYPEISADGIGGIMNTTDPEVLPQYCPLEPPAVGIANGLDEYLGAALFSCMTMPSSMECHIQPQQVLSESTTVGIVNGLDKYPDAVSFYSTVTPSSIGFHAQSQQILYKSAAVESTIRPATCAEVPTNVSKFQANYLGSQSLQWASSIGPSSVYTDFPNSRHESADIAALPDTPLAALVHNPASYMQECVDWREQQAASRSQASAVCAARKAGKSTLPAVKPQGRVEKRAANKQGMKPGYRQSRYRILCHIHTMYTDECGCT